MLETAPTQVTDKSFRPKLTRTSAGMDDRAHADQSHTKAMRGTLLENIAPTKFGGVRKTHDANAESPNTVDTIKKCLCGNNHTRHMSLGNLPYNTILPQRAGTTWTCFWEEAHRTTKTMLTTLQRDATTVNTMMGTLDIQKAIPEWSIPSSVLLLTEGDIRTSLPESWNKPFT